jgi:hypothetical protein
VGPFTTAHEQEPPCPDRSVCDLKRATKVADEGLAVCGQGRADGLHR